MNKGKTPREETENKSILAYISQFPKHNSDLHTLWYEIGHEAFLKAVQEPDGRRIIIYHDPEDEGICDPPIYWRYSKKRCT